MKKLELLIVEDSEVDAQLMERIIKKENLTEYYIWLKDGNQVIEYFLKEENAVPTVVLLDVKLPKISGLEIVKWLKNMERTKDVPVVMYSSSSEQRDIQTAYNNGANSYLVKPVEYAVMKKQFVQFYNYWNSCNLITYTNE